MKKKNYFLQKLFFTTKERTPFVLSFNGFLYLTATLFYYLNFKSLHNLKKVQFSFALKNDFKKFILKKYLRFKFNYFFSNNNNYANKTERIDAFSPYNTNFISNNSYFNTIYKVQDYDDAYNDLSSFSVIQKELKVIAIKRVKFKPGYMSI
jgi:hypothetical protein